MSRSRVLSILWSAFATYAFAGPILSPTHPNYTSQFDATLLRMLDGNLSGLPQQFPQYLIVYQPPLVGYLSPNNPAKWIVWTTLPASAGDPFQLANLNGFSPTPGLPPAANGDPIPEPRTLALVLLSLCAWRGLHIRLRNQPRAADRGMQHGEGPYAGTAVPRTFRQFFAPRLRRIHPPVAGG